MSMSKKDFEAIAAVIAEAADWVKSDPGITAEMMRRQMGEDLMGVCRAHHAGSGYSFDTGRFRRVAKLDD